MKFSKFSVTFSACLLALSSYAPAVYADNFRLSTVTNESSSRAVGGNRFGEIMKERSNGEMSLRVFPNAQLTGGDQGRQIDMLSRGAIDFAIISAIEATSLMEDMTAFSLPYLFSSYEQVDAVTSGVPGELLSDKAEEHGIKILAWGESGFREVTNNVRAIKGPDDIRGLKMRVAAPMFIDIMNELGANPVQIQWNETFGALQQGVVDGQENPIGAVIIPGRIYEVQDYLTLWNYSYDPLILAMSLDRWNALSENKKSIVQEAAVEAMEFQTELTRKQTEDGIALLKENGVEIYEPTDEEINAFRDATKNSFAKWSGRVDGNIMSAFFDTLNLDMD